MFREVEVDGESGVVGVFGVTGVFIVLFLLIGSYGLSYGICIGYIE